MAFVFISYSSNDKSIVSGILKKFQQYGDIFIDHNIIAGENFEKRLYQELHRANVVVLFISSSWLKSKWCFAEYTVARSLGKHIVPFIIDQTTYQEIDNHIDFSLHKLNYFINKKDALSKLIKEIHLFDLEIQQGFLWDKSRPIYRGMISYEEEDAAIFFGRKKETTNIVDKLHQMTVVGMQKILCIVAASGVGKSSLLKAGIIPLLKNTYKDKWEVLPTIRPGDDPLKKLALSITNSVHQETLKKDNYQTDIENLLNKLIQKNDIHNKKILIVIDQAEELFTISQKDSISFWKILYTLVEHKNIYAIMTLRADFLENLLSISKKLSNDTKQLIHLETLQTISLKGIDDIIRKPAHIEGIDIEESLINQLKTDLCSNEALPLLALMLSKLYEHYGKPHKQITLQDYKTYQENKVSPIENIVQKTANDTILPFQENKKIMQALKESFLHLVSLEKQGFVKNQAYWEDMPLAAHEALNALVDMRLLIKKKQNEHDIYSEEVIEIAHEALLKHWKLLANWLEKEKEFIDIRTKVELDFQRWKNKEEKFLSGRILSKAWKRRKQFPKEVQPYIYKSLKHNIFLKSSIVLISFSIILLSYGLYTQNYNHQIERINTSIKTDYLKAKGRIPNIHPEITLSNIYAYKALLDIYKVKNLTGNITKSLENYLTKIRSILINYPSHLLYAFKEKEKKDTSYSLYTIKVIDKNKFVVGSWSKSLYFFTKINNSFHIQECKLEDKIYSLAYDYNNKLLIAGLHNGSIYYKNITNHYDDCSFRKIKSHTKSIKSIIFSNEENNTFIYSGSLDKTICKYQIKKNNKTYLLQQLKTFKLSSQINDISISKKNLLVCALRNGTLGIVDTNLTQANYVKYHTNNVEKVYIDKNLSTIFSIGRDGKLVKSILQSNTIIKKTSVQVDKGRLLSLVASKNGRILFIGLSNGTIDIYNAETLTKIASLKEGHSRIYNLTLNPQNTQLYAISRNRMLKIYDISFLHDMIKLKISHQSVTNMVLSPNHNYLAIATHDKQISIYDTRTYEKKCQWNAHDDLIYALAINNSMKLISGSWDRSIKLWDINFNNSSKCSITLLDTYKDAHNSRIFDIQLHSKNTFYSASLDGTIKQWHINDNRIVYDYTYEQPEKQKKIKIYKLVFNPLTNKLYAALADGSIGYIYKNKLYHTKIKHKAATTSLCISPEKHLLFSGSSDHEIFVWHINKNELKLLRKLKGHNDSIYTLSYDNEQNLLYSGSVDGTIRIWDLNSTRKKPLFAILDRKQRSIIKIIKKDNHLYAGGIDGSIAVWNINNIINLSKLKNKLKQLNKAYKAISF